MRHDAMGETGLNYAFCRYGTSRLVFRGPRQPLDRPYLAFLGGTETFGKFVAAPFPAMVGEALETPAVNLGIANASIDAYLHEPVIKGIAQKAELTVLQITGARSMSNRFYTVHPRRNDRFVMASSVLRAIYPEVDFSDICFTRHLVATLWRLSPERFDILREELQTAWLARMRTFLLELGPRTLLLWFAPLLPSNLDWDERPDPLQFEPMFVTRAMIDALRPLVRGVVMVQPRMAPPEGGRIFAPQDAAAAAEMPDQSAHAEAAEALAGAIGAALGQLAESRALHQPAARPRE